MTPTKKILLINGPNLHLLGKREPDIYGKTTLFDIQKRLADTLISHQISLQCLQSNHEGVLVDKIAELGILADDGGFDGVIINPGAFTHTSVAIRDALMAANKPFVEVHLSNIHAREPFRHHSYFSDKALGIICGLGDIGYDMALVFLCKHLYGISL
ncbi:MAG: type II 3-dehydroquinate dehydratase [Moraxella sp.]